MATLKFAINYGHRNLTGGGAYGESDKTPVLGDAIRDALIAAGHEVFVVQEWDDDPDDSYTQGNLDVIGKLVRRIDAQHGPLTAFLDIHMEGNSAGIGGIFSIVPDADGLTWFTGSAVQSGDRYEDNSTDVALATAIAKYCGSIKGVGVRTGGVVVPGVMSETQTGVGGDGWRLAVFGSTYPLRDHCARLVVECGNVNDPGTRYEGFDQAMANGIVKAVASVYNVKESDVKDTPVSKPTEPTEADLDEWFGTVRGYRRGGPVSDCWRGWCVNNKRFPALLSISGTAGRMVYHFDGGLKILWAGGKAQVMTLPKTSPLA